MVEFVPPPPPNVISQVTPMGTTYGTPGNEVT